MIRLLRTDSAHAGFRSLVLELDRDLARRNGADNDFFAAFNKLDAIRHVVLACAADTPVGCGAMKPYGEDAMQIKRMFVDPAFRGRGLAAQVLGELEAWAASEGYRHFVLETGVRQPEAIACYTRSGYLRIPNYGQYVGVAESICFEKRI